MTYDSCLFKVEKLTGTALLSWTLVLGDSKIGQTNDIRTEIDVSRATVVPSAFTLDSDGAMSLDPSTATASMSFKAATALPASPLAYYDSIEINYDNVVIFQGLVAQIQCTIERDDPQIISGTNKFNHRYQYTFRSAAAWALDIEPAPVDLPAENPIARLQRWFTVDSSLLSGPQLTYVLGLTHASQTAESKSYLERAREFTELTELPLRILPSSPPTWNHLQILAKPVKWNGANPSADITSDDPCWIHSVDQVADQRANGEMLPYGLTVTANDTTFLEGFSNISVTGALLGTTFSLGVSRIGTSGQVPVGMGAGAVVKVYGDTMAIQRLTHNFGHDKYVATMELVDPITVMT